MNAADHVHGVPRCSCGVIPEGAQAPVVPPGVGPAEIGMITFAEMFAPAGSGVAPTAAQRLQQVLAEARAAEEAGLAVYGVGEHHRPDFAVSAPAVVLAAIAQHTNTIRLTSAATVLGCADPVRVFQDFATVDLLSGGRAEIIAGSGSFKETPPLFGVHPDRAHEAYRENLRLLTQIRERESIRWPGGVRQAIDGLGVYPRPETPLPLWAAAANSPASARLAGELGLPLVLGWFGQSRAHLHELVQAHRDAAAVAGRPRPKLAIQTHGHIADTTRRAADEYYPAYATTIARLKSGQRLSRDQYSRMCGEQGHLLIGDPSDIAGRIEDLRVDLGIERVLLHISAGAMPHERVLNAIYHLGEASALLTGRFGPSRPGDKVDTANSRSTITRSSI